VRNASFSLLNCENRFEILHVSASVFVGVLTNSMRRAKYFLSEVIAGKRGGREISGMLVAVCRATLRASVSTGMPTAIPTNPCAWGKRNSENRQKQSNDIR
jgi:hypothetical protein